jgi:hypothetical protein
MATTNKSFENTATYKYFETALTNPKMRARISQYPTTFGEHLLAFVAKPFVLPLYLLKYVPKSQTKIILPSVLHVYENWSLIS